MCALVQGLAIELSWAFSISGLNFSPKLEAYTSNLSIRSFAGALVPNLQTFTHEVSELSVYFQGLLRA